MRKLNVASVTFAVLVSTMAPAFAQSMALDFIMPGDSMGSLKMNHNVFNAFFMDSKGSKARAPKEFMLIYSKMSAADKAIVHAACSLTDMNKASFTDRITSACREAGL